MPERAKTGTFDQNKSDQYILSIRLSTDGFSFFVFDPDSDNYLHVAEKTINPELTYIANLKQAFRENPFLIRNYKKVFILLVTNRYTLVPLEVFDQSRMKFLYGFNLSPVDVEKVHHNLLANNSCVVLFGIDGNIQEYLREKFPEPVIYSQISVLTEYFSLRSRTMHHKQMFINTRNESLDIYCYERGFISLVNSYVCKSLTDNLYFILYAWKQLGMDQQKDELNVADHSLSASGDLVAMLSKFVKKINLLPGLQYNSTDVDVRKISLDIQALLYLKGKI